MLTAEDQERIRERVEDAMGWSMEIYNFTDVINDTNITQAEKEWAKEHLDWKVVIKE